MSSKGNKIPQPYTCSDKTHEPYTTQTIQGIVVSCTTETRIPGACLDADATYTITVTVERSMVGVPCSGRKVDKSDSLVVDKVHGFLSQS